MRSCRIQETSKETRRRNVVWDPGQKTQVKNEGNPSEVRMLLNNDASGQLEGGDPRALGQTHDGDGGRGEWSTGGRAVMFSQLFYKSRTILKVQC